MIYKHKSITLNGFLSTLCILIATILLPSIIFSQATTTENLEQVLYKKISVTEPDAETLKKLNEIGIDLSCGAIFKNNNLELELDEITIHELNKEEINYSILIEDLSTYYSKRAVEDLPKARKELEILKKSPVQKKSSSVLKNLVQHSSCNEIDWAVPTNFNLNPNNSPNSFGGCLTYSQVLQELDDMRTQYPHLISSKLDASPNGQTTLEGRQIFYVRISDNPDIDETSEPETLYQSLIHSRESASVMQLLYYMWYVLENYDSDQNIKNLVNNQALYFIPVFNPDGFVYNETQNPDGGGMQRKNRNIGSSACGSFSQGVDLNRNSAYYWGNGGSSSNPCSNTYLGEAPFSENETQIMRDFFLQHDFKLAMNHHSFKNAMLHAYAGTTITNPRADEYSKYSHDMSYYNRYAYGPSTSISSLNSGNMNDWMLGGIAGISSNGTPTGTGSGKNTLAWTPENGSGSEGGFWPLPSNFVSISKRAMRMNFLAAYFSGKYAKLHNLNQSDINSLNGSLNFGIENLGQTASDFTVTLTPVSPNITSVGSAITESGIPVLQQKNIEINYVLNPNIQAGEEIEFKVTLLNDYSSDSMLYETNITMTYQPSLLFSDNPDIDGLSNWTLSGGAWDITADSYSGSSAITSTVQAPYLNSESKTLQLISPINFGVSNKVLIQYYAKWDLERSFDYAQFEASVDGTNWTPLCTKLTKPGAPDENNTYSSKSSQEKIFQPDNEPLYDGDTQGKWRVEEIIIDDSTNSFLLNQNTVYLRFNFKTDESNHQDAYYNANFEGFIFDDFKCITSNSILVGENKLNNHNINIYPNPNNGKFILDAQNTTIKNILIRDGLGKLLEVPHIKSNAKNTLNLNVKPGIYYMHLELESGVKMIKLIVS